MAQRSVPKIEVERPAPSWQWLEAALAFIARYREASIAAVAVLLVVYIQINNSVFLSSPLMSVVLRDTARIGLIAVGIVLVMITGEIANARLSKCSKPTIARIRGFCVGGGVAVSLTCDIRIASDNCKFGVPAARLGLGYRAAGIKTLMDVVGPAYAKEIFFTGRMFSAQEALGMGLINRVVADAELDAYVDDYCKRIGENAPLTMHAAKRTIELRFRGLHRRPYGLHGKTPAAVQGTLREEPCRS